MVSSYQIYMENINDLLSSENGYGLTIEKYLEMF